jgi:hypothetical protein
MNGRVEVITSEAVATNISYARTSAVFLVPFLSRPVSTAGVGEYHGEGAW